MKCTSIYDKQIPRTQFIEHSMRFYGQPKLSKPKQLKGIRQFSSVPFISKKCTCPVLIKDNDVWIKHSDYFSEPYTPNREEIGMPLNYFAEKFLGKDRPKNFVYGDAWGSVVFRNEAWIVLKDLIVDLQDDVFVLDIKSSILRQKERYLKFSELELEVGDWDRFYEKVINETRKYLKGSEKEK